MASNNKPASPDDAIAKAIAGDDKKPAAAGDELELRAVVPLAENRMRLKEFQNPGFWICVPVGTEVQDLLQPSLWANIARTLKPTSLVEVHWDDATWFAEVYVLSCGRNWASVSILRAHRLEKPSLPQEAARYGVSYNGPVDRFRVTRFGDGAVMQGGFSSELDARKWLAEYLTKLAA